MLNQVSETGNALVIIRHG